MKSEIRMLLFIILEYHNWHTSSLNGIFGNTDLILTYLSSIHEILYKPEVPKKEKDKEKEKEKEGPVTCSPEEGEFPKSPCLAAISSFKEVEDKSEIGLLKYMLEQVMQSTESIQKCAEHQKCMTDDVLHLSRLRSHKLAISNSFYHPWETIMTASSIFRQQADTKVYSESF